MARHFNEFEPPCQMEVEPCRRIFESGLRTRHFLRGFFAPLGCGLFSTRSTSKGISEAARMLSEKVSRPDENSSVLDGISDGKGRLSNEIGFGKMGAEKSSVSRPFNSWSFASV